MHATDYRNLSQLFHDQARRLGARPALRSKHFGLYRDWSWSRYLEIVDQAAAAWVSLGVERGDRIALLAENRVEWLASDLSILAAGAADVSIHAPLTAAQVAYQVADSGARWAVVSNAEQFAKLHEVQDRLPELEGVVSFDCRGAEGWRKQFLTWHAFLNRGWRAGAAALKRLCEFEHELSADDLAAIMYTSGTTGEPKGVILTHGNLLSNAIATCSALPPGDVAVQLSWLPYSHIYARLCDHYVSLLAGTTVAIAEGIDRLRINLAEIQPTHMTGVPRFYEKVWDSVAGDVPERRAARLREMFGPRLRWVSAGGAPLPEHIARGFLEAGVPLLQGYGLTESSPVISTNTLQFNRVGTVGRAIPGVEIQIAADGEVLSRGPHIMQGYWRKPDATHESVRDKWLYTGDLGEIDGDGFLRITGRKKDLIVLSNGKKVVPAYIESLLLAEPFIDQVVVYGDNRPFLTAIIVLSRPSLLEAARELGLAGEVAELAQQSQIRARLDDCIAERLREVSPAERVRRYVLLTEPFTLAADELTPTMKVRRKQVIARHQNQIDNLYTES